MRRAFCGLAILLLAMATGANATELALFGEQLGCTSARGEFVAFLAPGSGIILLATRDFPGGSPVGTVSADRLEATISGHGTVSLDTDTQAGTRVWGLLDRSLEIGDQRGCFTFGGFRWSTVDDLKTYVHWGVREILANIPYDESAGENPPVVELGDRRVTLELLAPDGRLLQLTGVEGTTFGFQPPDTEATLFFQPFVIGADGRRVAVRVSVKEGAFFGPGITTEVAFVIISADPAIELPTEPVVTLRLAGVEDRVTFVN